MDGWQIMSQMCLWQPNSDILPPPTTTKKLRAEPWDNFQTEVIAVSTVWERLRGEGGRKEGGGGGGV